MTDDDFKRRLAAFDKYPECLTTITTSRFDFKDRLKILMTGFVCTEVKTFFKGDLPERGEQFTEVMVRWPLLWRRPKLGGYEAPSDSDKPAPSGGRGGA